MDENDPTLSLPYQNTTASHTPTSKRGGDHISRKNEEPQRYTQEQQQAIMTKLLMQHLRARTHFTQASVQVARRIEGILDVDDRTVVPLHSNGKDCGAEAAAPVVSDQDARRRRRRRHRMSKKRAEYEEVKSELEERKRQKRVKIQQLRLDRAMALGIRESQLPPDDDEGSDSSSSIEASTPLKDLMQRRDEDDALGSSVSNDGDDFSSSESDSREDIDAAQLPSYQVTGLPSKSVKADVEAKRSEIRDIRRAIKRYQRGLGEVGHAAQEAGNGGGESANEALAALKASRALAEDTDRRRRLEEAAQEFATTDLGREELLEDSSKALSPDQSIRTEGESVPHLPPILPGRLSRVVNAAYRLPEEILKTQYDAQLQRIFTDPSKRGAGEDMPLPPGFDGLSVSAITESLCADANEVICATESIMRTVNDSSRRQRRTASVDSDLDRANRAILKGVLWMTEGSHQLDRLLNGLANIQQSAFEEVIERRRGISSRHEELDQFGRQLDRQREEIGQFQKIKDELARELLLKKLLLGHSAIDSRPSSMLDKRGSVVPSTGSSASSPPTPSSKPPTPSNARKLSTPSQGQASNVKNLLMSQKVSIQAMLRLRQLLGKWVVMAGPSKGPSTGLSGAQQQAAMSPLAALFAKNKALAATKAGVQPTVPSTLKPSKPSGPLRPIEVALEAVGKELLTRTTMAELRVECLAVVGEPM
eukprot:GILI01023493.1.p1 GENE.GILI01023493.1~~GILI01023493.1.p1  ORF type:complete len:798 (-),score=144.00 GILI01023493.1:43-2163(-)